MDLYVLNPDREIIGLIDDASSVIWTPRYKTAGDFEIYVRATTYNLSLLQPGNYIMRLDSDMVGIVQNIQLTTDAENGDYLTVTGPDLADLLRRRIVWTQTILTGTVENALRRLVNENIISPTKTTRQIPGFVLGTSQGFTETISKQITGDNLLEAISAICDTYGYGFRVVLNDSRQYEFQVYRGVDRSESQSAVPRVAFTPDYDNITSSEYGWDESNYANVALVAGEGEGLARRQTAVGDTSGLNRYEVYVDARNISSNDGEITEADYINQLREQGVETLAERAIVETFSGEIIPGQTYQYGVDYFLGDIVTVANEYGIRNDVRIVEIIESEDETGYKIIPTFEYGLESET